MFAQVEVEETFKTIRQHLDAVRRGLDVLKAMVEDLQRSAAERERAENFRMEMEPKPPTEAQLRYLKRLGLKPARELTRREVSEILTKLAGTKSRERG
ncbi:MAG: DUF1687 domain-containing protein [Deltaproteobacteria bacterium]|nr:DUF1687 domain-containing protein [Deltaproteobacteria bacterium]